jgi:hypothetical protein
MNAEAAADVEAAEAIKDKSPAAAAPAPDRSGRPVLTRVK